MTGLPEDGNDNSRSEELRFGWLSSTIKEACHGAMVRKVRRLRVRSARTEGQRPRSHRQCGRDDLAQATRSALNSGHVATPLWRQCPPHRPAIQSGIPVRLTDRPRPDPGRLGSTRQAFRGNRIAARGSRQRINQKLRVYRPERPASEGLNDRRPSRQEHLGQQKSPPCSKWCRRAAWPSAPACFHEQTGM
jgi:hypothetical protein